jgi:hypothetical protein
VLGETRRVVEFKITIYFVGRDVVQALVMLANCFEDSISTNDVGIEEWARVLKGVVIMRLGCVVNDEVMFSDETVDELGVGDITFDEGHT